MQASRLSGSLRKLRRSQSHIMSVYYAFLWIISILQLLRFVVQVGEGASHAILWNLSWLLTRFGADYLSWHAHEMANTSMSTVSELHRTSTVCGAC